MGLTRFKPAYLLEMLICLMLVLISLTYTVIQYKLQTTTIIKTIDVVIENQILG